MARVNFKLKCFPICFQEVNLLLIIGREMSTTSHGVLNFQMLLRRALNKQLLLRESAQISISDQLLKSNTTGLTSTVYEQSHNKVPNLVSENDRLVFLLKPR